MPTHPPTATHVSPQLGPGPHTGRDGYYEVEDNLRAAVDVALTLGMPLLLTGEPGCGKTDFAWVVAQALGWPIRATQIRSDTTARDLLYRYDALHRLMDAQAGDSRASDPRQYLTLEALGEALISPEPMVVLLDEIDKAPRDLPNDLLTTMDRGEFEIVELPHEASTEHRLRRHMAPASGEAQRPLVVITSNAEHQLPDPFLRRCVFHHVTFPDRSRLVRILHKRLPTIEDGNRLADLFFGLRAQKLVKPPATSEFLAWARSLHAVFDPDDVDDLLALLHDDLADHTLRTRSWHELPGLACLVKLRQDLDTLQA